jgi:hypothetical protein
LSGKLVRSIDSGLYVPAHLSFGQDRSWWAFGWQNDEARWSTIDGKETGAYLPKSLFESGLPPGMDEWQRRRITVTTDRAGVEAVTGNIGNQREWVELDLNGNLKGRWKLDPQNQFPGVVFTSDDQAYVHRYNRATKSKQVFRLNRTTSSWDLVNAPDAVLYGGRRWRQACLCPMAGFRDALKLVSAALTVRTYGSSRLACYYENQLIFARDFASRCGVRQLACNREPRCPVPRS